jgi:eukaryotic-like serine/threonine-protein kinase
VRFWDSPLCAHRTSAINPERWRQVDRILEEALDLPPEQRTRFIDQACDGNEALRRDVEVMLQAHDKAGNFLDDPAMALAARQIAADQKQTLLGQTLVHYRILSLIGAGGMGEVYRATDTRLSREVAIKVLPVVFSKDADRLRRFEQEARAAGMLNHPNILIVHDIGTHEGALYIVLGTARRRNTAGAVGTSSDARAADRGLRVADCPRTGRGAREGCRAS